MNNCMSWKIQRFNQDDRQNKQQMNRLRRRYWRQIPLMLVKMMMMVILAKATIESIDYSHYCTLSVLLLTIPSSCDGFILVTTGTKTRRISTISARRKPQSVEYDQWDTTNDDDTYIDSDNNDITTSSSNSATTTKTKSKARQQQVTTSPMDTAGWKAKKLTSVPIMTNSNPNGGTTQSTGTTTSGGGRGRSRKRSTYYNCLSNYHEYFLKYLTMEYQEEEQEVLNRIQKANYDYSTTLQLETNLGYALFDMYIERRGNLYQAEVYRLTKATDATTPTTTTTTATPRNKMKNNTTNNNEMMRNNNPIRFLPSNHKFTNNDVILLTVQPAGSGDFFFIPPMISSMIVDEDSSSLQNDSNNDNDNSDTHPITDIPTYRGRSRSTSSTTSAASSVEARVLNTGPTYIDIVMTTGSFEKCFQQPAPNDKSGYGNKGMRLRVDKFFSDVPYQRMVAALSQLTAITSTSATSTTAPAILTSGTSTTTTTTTTTAARSSKKPKPQTTQKVATSTSTISTNSNENNIVEMDPLFRDVVLTTFSGSASDDQGAFHPIPIDTTKLTELSSRLSRPPLGPLSQKLAKEVLHYMQYTNPNTIFRPFNGPQLIAIEAALTRRFTMIQGPPGTGKTACAAAIAFGFVHQCRSLHVLTTTPKERTVPNTNQKVLACAFSNVGADNVAESLLQLGLKIVRVGNPSAISESLWNHTLEAAIDRDPDAKKAYQNAASVSAARLSTSSKRLGLQHGSNKDKSSTNRWDQSGSANDALTLAVKASIEAAAKAATRALRDADVIISTLTGASDPRLLAACGIVTKDVNNDERKSTKEVGTHTEQRRGGRNDVTESSTGASKLTTTATTPDGLPPLSLPFVIIDEACQSVEAATLIPIVTTNSCRSLVLLGDPCQLPPTVRSQEAMPSLSISLMERLASTLLITPPIARHHQVVQSTSKGIGELLEMDDTYLNSRQIRQAISLIDAAKTKRDDDGERKSYRKTYNGSILLSIQYRMHPSIAALPSAIFYNSLLASPAIMNDRRTFPIALQKSMPCAKDSSLCVRFIDVGGKNNERRGVIPLPGVPAVSSYSGRSDGPSSTFNEEQTTYWNQAEADRVLSLIKEMVDVRDETSGNQTIGVITPYLGQVQLIKSIVASDNILLEKLLKSGTTTIEVKSVDGYQGRERDVIIFSTVRSNPRQSIGFLHDWRRLNVALTRAKSALIIIGDLECLSNSDKHWNALAKWIQGVHGVVSDAAINDMERKE